MANFENLLNPKRLGIWNFMLCVFYGISICFLYMGICECGVGFPSYVLFVVISVVGLLFYYSILSATLIKQKALRVVFKILLVLVFLSIIILLLKSNFLMQIVGMLTGSCGHLGSRPGHLQIIPLECRIITRGNVFLSFFIPVFYAISLLLSGECGRDKAK